MPTVTPDTRNEAQQPEAARLLSAVERIAESLERLVDHFAPPPPDIVGTSYVAHRLACTQVWITDLIRQGEGGALAQAILILCSLVAFFELVKMEKPHDVSTPCGF